MADDDDKETNNSKSLEDFVTEHYKQQKEHTDEVILMAASIRQTGYMKLSVLKAFNPENGKLNATDEIDDQRASDFFARALAESRRMNIEVDKSEKKLAKLHAELGSEKVAAWQAEHAAEVLTPAQMEHMGIKQPS